MAVTSAWYILLFYLVFSGSDYRQLIFRSVLGCGFDGDFLSEALMTLILNYEDFDLISSICYLDIPLFKSKDIPGKNLVLALRKIWANIFMATSCLSGIFLLFYLEGLTDLSYLRPSLILLQSFLNSSGLKSTRFLEMMFGELD